MSDVLLNALFAQLFFSQMTSELYNILINTNSDVKWSQT